MCEESCADEADVCGGTHSVVYFVAGTRELVDPTEVGCTIACEPQEQDCTSDCEREEVRTATSERTIYRTLAYGRSVRKHCCHNSSTTANRRRNVPSIQQLDQFSAMSAGHSFM